MGKAGNMSVLGLYQWDDTIFDNLVIPSDLDATIVTDNILAECAELEVLYPNPTVFKALVGVWSRKENPVWEKLWATTQYEYNPIENYNRYTDESIDTSRLNTTGGSDSRSGTQGNTFGGSDTTATTNTGSNTTATTHGGSDSWSETAESEQGGTDTIAVDTTETLSGSDEIALDKTETLSGTDTTLHKIAAYDSTVMVDQYSDATTYGKVNTTDSDQTTTYGKETTTDSDQTTTYGKTEERSGSGTNTYGATENVTETLGTTSSTTVTHGQTLTGTNSETTNYGKTDNTTGEQVTEYHSHGNIGVTTTQKLIKEQRDIDRFNLYDIIVESFKMRFCIMVY